MKSLRVVQDSPVFPANSQSDKTDKSLALVVRNLSDLTDKVVPFFDNKFIIKKDAFDKFKRVLKLVKLKRHLTKNGMKQILDISYLMNTQKRKFSKEEILRSY